jgi:hypothetical protein
LLLQVLFQMGLSREKVNSAIRRYKDWAPDVRIPPINPELAGAPKAESNLRMTGRQVQHFTAHRCVRCSRTGVCVCVASPTSMPL